MLDRLPDNVLKQIIEYLRSWDYSQEDLRQLSQVNQRLHSHAIAHVWEFFTITDVVITGKLQQFLNVQPHLCRLLVSDDEDITDEQWFDALAAFRKMDWSHISMFSIELDTFNGRTDACTSQIIDFVHECLGSAQEQWVALSEERSIAEWFFTKNYENVKELRIIGISVIDVAQWHSEPRLQLPEYRELGVMFLDGASAELTEVTELVRKSCLTLHDINIYGFTSDIAKAIGIAHNMDGRSRLKYPNLRRIAISNRELEVDLPNGILDGTQMPGLQLLYFSESVYPSYGGQNIVTESDQVRLMCSEWENVRFLAVDGISHADVALLGQSMRRLEFLSIGSLGNDVELGDTLIPSVPVGLGTLGSIIESCSTLVDLRVEMPELYEDMYNTTPSAIAAATAASPGLSAYSPPPSFERPFDPSVRRISHVPHANLMHVTLNSWALTFDQLLLLFDSLHNLRSFEGILKFTSRYPVTEHQRLAKHRYLSQLSLAHCTASKHKHIFKSNLLKFVSMLVNLITLDIYGELEFPGLEHAIGRVVPGCTAGVYQLIPTWLLDAIDAENEGAV
ncbi:hypothetical protein IW140_006158 [Coemansia sp. RSA 1813]|nr:hypothetical protein EV178_006204 [Coemansia sp. RSA 1646]KAJ1766422.1 hypothetical protein LPJ74_005896 [Coemansia sp. RSA 1843]KAJ2085939.1 hypothetical protein IW138_006012 [Coemansia sp. RSA 986]KAJ2210574.1 hypothetical protein EV179_006138 [Coemansia sp. RSA 487]KAJ2563325.1 hypothetical protein IW140_006158 [Coemansia sp. RSA 1813]